MSFSLDLARLLAARLLPEAERDRLRGLRFQDAGHGYDSFGLHPDVVALAEVLLGPMYDRYFRVSSYGCTEAIPTTGAAVIAANHSGAVPVDGALLWLDVLRHTNPPRVARTVADHFVPMLPVIGTFFARGGMVGGSRGNARVLLETGELLLERVGKGKRAGMEDLGELCDGFRVQGVGLSETAFGFGEVADLSGIDASDGKTCAVGLGDEEGFVAATGFADEHGVGGKGFEAGANGFFGVRDLRGLAVVVDVEEEFRNVDTEVGCHEVVFQGGWCFSGMFFLRLAIRPQRFRQLFKIETCVEGGSS